MMTESVRQQTTAEPSRRRWLTFWACASVVAVVAVVLVLVRGHVGKRPAPTDDPAVVAKYLATPDFVTLGFDEQRAYLMELRKNAEAVSAAHAGGKLNEEQVRTARAGAWMGGKLEHLREYLKQPSPQAKQDYVDKMLVHRKEKKAPATSAAAVPAGAVAAAPDDTAYFYSSDVKRIVGSWSKRRRAEWEEFHKVTHERKQRLAVGDK
jgi:hypothetical protein